MDTELTVAVKRLSLEGVAASAQILPDGRLKGIVGLLPKLLAALEKQLTPAHTVVVAFDQDLDGTGLIPDRPNPLIPDPLNPHFFHHREKNFTLIKARDIAEAFRLVQIERETRFPAIDCDDVLQWHHRHGFVGRDWLWSTLNAFLAARDPDHPGYLLLEGAPGFGKSAIVAELVRTLDRPVYHFIKKDRPGWDDPEKFLPSLISQIRRRVAPQPVKVTMTDPADKSPEDRRNRLGVALADAMEQAARGMPEGVPLIVLLDGLDEAFGPLGQYAQVALPGLLPARLPQNVKFILTSRPGEFLTWRRDERVCQSIPLDSRGAGQEHDIRLYLTQRNTQSALSLSVSLLDRLTEAAEGNFQAAALSLRERPGLAAELDRWQREPKRIPRGLDGWLESFWEQSLKPPSPQSPRNWKELVKGLLGLLAGAAKPLSADLLTTFLSALLRTESNHRIGFLPVQALADQLNELLTHTREWFESGSTGDGESPKLQFFHTRVREFINEPKQLKTVEREDCQRLLAHVCERWADLSLPDEARRYALRHGPRHWIGARGWDDLEALLTSPAFLEAKASAPGEEGGPPNLMFELAVDLSEAADAIPLAKPASKRKLELISEAVGWDLHFLSRHPECLFQCLWNRCWWYDCADAETLYEKPKGGSGNRPPPWKRTGEKLSAWMEAWGLAKQSAEPGFSWLRSSRPPLTPLGSAQRMLLMGHTDSVVSVAVSHDGNRIISASYDKMVRVWDARTRKEALLPLTVHTSFVTSVAISADGSRIVSGLWDHTVRLWDASTGKEMLPRLTGHTGAVTSVAISSNGDRIISGSDDNTVRVWNARTGKQMLPPLKGHKHGVTSIAISGNGDRIISGSNDETVRVWDARTGGQMLPPLKGHKRGVTSVAVSNDGERVISGSDDKTVRVWDASTGKQVLPPLRGHAGTVSSVAISRNGDFIVSAADDKTIRVWDARTGKEALPPLTGHTGEVTSIAICHASDHIVSGSNDKTVRVWDVRKGKEVLPSLMGHTGTVTSIDISLDGSRVISGSHDDTIRLWDARSGGCIEIHELAEDMHPIYAGPATYIENPVEEDFALRLESVDGQAIGWFEERLDEVVATPDRRKWAGFIANHVYILEWINGFRTTRDLLGAPPTAVREDTSATA